MVTALVKGKRIEIENLADLLKVVESSIRDMESLVLFGDCEERLKIGPGCEDSAFFSREQQYSQ